MKKVSAKAVAKRTTRGAAAEVAPAKNPASKRALQRESQHSDNESEALEGTTGGELADNQAEGGERRVEGQKLIKLIKKKLIDNDLPERYIADLMGVTTIYWSSMVNGHRKIRSLGKDKLEKVADFLGIPTVQVLILAEAFEPSDFYVKRTLEDELALVLETMLSDQSWVAFTPSKKEWAKLPVNIKLLITLLYERECGRVMLQKVKMEHPELAEKLQAP